MAGRRGQEPPVLLTHYQPRVPSLDMYLSEVRSIRESRVLDTPPLQHQQRQQQQQKRQPPQVPDKGRGGGGSGGGGHAAHTAAQEHDADPDSSEEEDNELFLRAAGFGSVVHDLQRQVESGVNSDDSGELDTQTEGLTRSHAQLIKKRVHTLRSTLRHKRSQEGENSSRGDVRDIFKDKSGKESSNQVSGIHGATNHASSSYRGTHHLMPVAMTPPKLPPKPKGYVLRNLSSSVAVPTISTSPRQQPNSAEAELRRLQTTPPTLGQSASASDLLELSSSRRRSGSDGTGANGHSVAALMRTNQTSQSQGDSSGSSEMLDLSLSRHRSGSDSNGQSAAHMRPHQSSPQLRRKPGNLLGVEGKMRKSPKSSNSPEHEDIKLHFGVGSPVKGVPNGITENLPRFTICPEPLGIAQTVDISSHEQNKVRGLALLELQVTFDDMGLPLRLRRPVKPKNLKEKGVFGVSLSHLLHQDQQRAPNTQLPLILTEILGYLETEGLYEEGLLRVSGSTARIKAMVDEIESMPHCEPFSLKKYMNSKRDCKVTDVASILKQFIRELPVPLLTRQYLSAFASIADITDLKEQVRTLNLLVLVLPDLHQGVLKRLMEFCQRVINHSSQNKMTLTNIAMVIAPNLFTLLQTRHTMNDVTMAAKTSHVVRLLIYYHDLLWTVPSELLRQVRYLNECEVKRVNQRSLQKAMKQMQEREPEVKKSTSYLVTVHGPLYLCVRKMIHFKQGTTAVEVLERFERKTHLNEHLIKRRFCSNPETIACGSQNGVGPQHFDAAAAAGEMFLHEVGGNIVERCLPSNTDVYLLYETNPRTEFVIKPRHCPDIGPAK